MSQPFFERDRTKRAITEIGEADAITLVLGAGVSADSGLPPWRALLRSVLVTAAEQLHVPTDDQEKFADQLVERHGYLTAGAIAQSVLGAEHMTEALRQGLYKGVQYQPVPQFHADIAADLIIQQIAEKKSPAVVTTNYDVLIEESLRKRLPGGQVSGTYQPVTVMGRVGELPDSVIPVHHIHGCVPPAGTSMVPPTYLGAEDNNVIIGERDYALLQDGSAHWQDETMMEALSSGATCLFSGMSLSDANIIRYLTYPTSPRASGPRFALLSTQSEQRYATELSPGVGEKYDEAVNRRLSELNVQPVKADFYIQVPQFLNEVLLYRSHHQDWHEDLWYGARLSRWRQDMDRVITASQGSEFDQAQRLVNLELRRVVRDEVLPIIERDSVDVREGERFSLEVWLRNPRSQSRSLELWGSSTSTWSSYEDLAKARIGFNSTYSAVTAYMRGGFQFRANGRNESRWKYQLWQLVRLREEPWFNLPVGVLVLSSNLDRGRSCLSGLSHAGERLLQSLILETGQRLCDPMTADVELERHR
jgi:SIR2-like domain